MSRTSGAGAARPEATEATPLRIAIGIGLGVALLIGLFAAAFLWPITTASPQRIPVAVVGPDPAVAAIEGQLNSRNADLFDVTVVADRDAAVRAIETREALGAIVVGQPTEILTTSAGSPQVAQILTQLASAINAQAGPRGQPAVTVTDVVPVGAVGAAANIILLPVLIGGIASAVLSLVLVRTPVRRFVTLGVAAVVGGLVGAAVLGPWFDVLEANYWVVSAALAMGILAISAFIAGLGTLFGRAGLGLGIILIVLVGNPWAGLFAPREFLIEPIATIGAYMPNGTVVDLLRSINFFPNAATGGNWLVLAIWAVVGLLMLGIGAALPRDGAAAPASEDTH